MLWAVYRSGATRVIFQAGKGEAGVNMNNTSKYPFPGAVLGG